MYALYIAGTRFPVPPDKINMNFKGKNETVTLIDEGEINLIKKPGLTEYSFEIMLPINPYHFAYYENNDFQPPEYYTDLLEFLMTSGSYFTVDLYRERPSGGKENELRAIEMPVTLESYTITEDAKEGQDWTVELNFKYYRAYGTKVLVQNADGTGYVVARTDAKEPVRVVVVKNGETLASICRREFKKDDRETIDRVYRLNRAEIDRMNKADTSYIVENAEEWSGFGFTSKANAAALIDKAFLGGHNEKAAGINPEAHWSQPYVMSLRQKGAVTDLKEWLINPDGNVSQAILMALMDKITGGTCQEYVDREADHWGRNHLDSLCDKAIIGEPENWLDFDGPVLNSNTLALVNKALNATIDKYAVYPGMRLVLWEKKR